MKYRVIGWVAAVVVSALLWSLLVLTAWSIGEAASSL